MTRRRSLRHRLAWTFAAFGSAMGLLLAFGIWLAAHDVSQRLMDETLGAELADYIARRARNPSSLPPASASLKGFLLKAGDTATGLPPEIARLPVGHHEVTLAGIPHRVAIADHGEERYILLFDETRQKQREWRFLSYLAASVLLLSILAALAGRWLAGRVAAPVSALAATVRAADPAQPLSIAPAAAGDGGDEVAALAQAFALYHARLVAFIERERVFAADASHELRTPLAALRGAIEVIADDPAMQAAHGERLARIERAIVSMQMLVEALVLLAREENLPERQSCDAIRLARECAERYRPLAESQGTQIVLDLPPELSLPVPAGFLAIVIANLLHNAVTHTRRGEIVLALDGQGMRVADSGSGIPAERLPHVFERHVRGPDSHGAGIGLALVKRICERLGWRAELLDTPGGGTTARIDFGIAGQP
jgi:signal transduction histidine kinase